MKPSIYFYSFLFIFIQSTIFSFGQLPVIEWQHEYGPHLSELTCSRPTFDGGYILGGSVRGNQGCGKTENAIGGSTQYYDYWVVKIDAAGNLEWENTIGGSKSDMLQAVQQTADGGYILAGYSFSGISGDKNESLIGIPSVIECDYWIVKLDESGTIEWENTIGGVNIDHAYAIEQTYDGGYILGGYSASNISGDKTSNRKGNVDYWIIKLDESGNITWQQTIGSNSQDDFMSLNQTSDHGYILSGGSYGQRSGDKSEYSCDSLTSTCYWVVKIDEEGNIEWDRTLSGTGSDYNAYVLTTNDRGYLIGGSSDSQLSCDKTENHCGQSDFWIIKLDYNGDVQWDNTIGGISSDPVIRPADQITSMIQTGDGGYLIGGISGADSSCDKSEANRGSIGGDYWIVKVDSLGVVQWDKSIGGSNGEELYSIQNTDDYGYLLAGWSNSSISGEKTIDACSAVNFWVLKLSTQYNNIIGKIYIDANSNQIQDSNEVNVQSKLVSETNSGRFSVTNPDGFYNLLYFDSGSVTVKPQVFDYYDPVPPDRSINFSGFIQTDSLNDFALQPTGVFDDLCVSISAFGPFRPGFMTSYHVTYENVGTTSLNGTIVFYNDPDLAYQYSNLPPIVNSTDSIIWDLGLLSPFEQGSFNILVQLDSNVSVGTVIFSSVRMEPVAGDANIVCNYASWESDVTSSYDPNAMIVNLDTVLVEDFPSPPYLEYIVYFQNTGNDTAFNVKILNTIPHHLDINSFELIASSHPLKTSYNNLTRKMEFRFDNLLLPDSNVNEMASHGFVHYKIKPEITLKDGDKIYNSAYIFFDFNQPVVTNTVHSLVYSYCKQFNSVNISSSSICEGDTISAFNNSIYNYANNFQWYLDSVLYSTDSAIILTGLSIGKHWLKLNVDTLTCHVSSTKQIRAYENPTPAFTVSNDSLISSASFFSYQWLLNGIPVPGATKSSYVVSQSGWYSLLVSEYTNCTGVSDSVYMNYLGIAEYKQKHVFLSPNPAFEQIVIKSQEEIFSIQICDLLGRVTYASDFTNNRLFEKDIDVINFKPGVYIAEVKLKNNTVRLKFVRE